MSEWQPIETYVDIDRPHARGLWVYNHHTQQPMYFQADVGWIDDDGNFVNDNGDFGWEASDYRYWMPLPSPPNPEPQLQHYTPGDGGQRDD